MQELLQLWQILWHRPNKIHAQIDQGSHSPKKVGLQDLYAIDLGARPITLQLLTLAQFAKPLNEPPRGKPRGIRGGAIALFPALYLDFLHSARPLDI